MQIELVPAFTDNYIFLLTQGDRALVVDPGSASEVLHVLRARNLTLTHILITHHHGDHIGGVAELLANTKAELWGPASLEQYGLNLSRTLKDRDRFHFENCEFECLAVPGHTLDHLAFFSASAKALFCGDTLFSLGCGRLFEGTFEQMHTSLMKIRQLPRDIAVYCAHEYSLSNATFSVHYVRENQGAPEQIAHYESLLEEIKTKRDRGIATVPSSIGFEERNNLFLRANNVDEFKHVRIARNSFVHPSL